MQKWIWNSALWNRQGAMHTAFSLSRNRETMTWHGQGILNILFFMNFTKAIIITKYCLVRDTWIMHHNLTWWNARGRIALESRKGFPCNFVFYSFPNCTQLPKVFLTVRRNNNVTAPIRIICPVPRLHYSGSVNHSRESHGPSWTCDWNELAVKAWERATQELGKCIMTANFSYLTTYYHVTTFMPTYMKWCSTFLSLHIWVCSSIK